MGIPVWPIGKAADRRNSHSPRHAHPALTYARVPRLFQFRVVIPCPHPRTPRDSPPTYPACATRSWCPGTHSAAARDDTVTNETRERAEQVLGHTFKNQSLL